MVRDAARRKKKYEAGVDGEAIGRKIGRLKPGMVEQESLYFAEIAEVERKAKAFCEQLGIASWEVAMYLIVARQCYSLAKRFTQATRDQEAQRLVNLWAARGLNPGLLADVCRAGGCHVDRAASITLTDVLDDIAVLDHHTHSRWRVYPQDVTAAPVVTAGTPANTFGSWVQAIPLNTIPFPFHIIGFCVCLVSAATNYHLRLGYNTINADPGPNMELGERRFRIATVPIAKQTELLEIYSQGIPANSRVMAKLKTASGALDTANITLVLTRHVDILRPVPLWPAFPW